MHRRYRRLIAAEMLPIYLAACTQWTAQPVSPMQVQALSEQDTKIRVTLADGTRLEFDNISVTGDSLVGLTAGTRGEEAHWDKVGLDQIVLLEAASENNRKVLYLVAVTAVVTALVVVVGRSVTPNLGD